MYYNGWMHGECDSGLYFNLDHTLPSKINDEYKKFLIKVMEFCIALAWSH